MPAGCCRRRWCRWTIQVCIDDGFRLRPSETDIHGQVQEHSPQAELLDLLRRSRRCETGQRPERRRVTVGVHASHCGSDRLGLEPRAEPVRVGRRLAHGPIMIETLGPGFTRLRGFAANGPRESWRSESRVERRRRYPRPHPRLLAVARPLRERYLDREAAVVPGCRARARCYTTIHSPLGWSLVIPKAASNLQAAGITGVNGYPSLTLSN
jgi:hypothetical protein